MLTDRFIAEKKNSGGPYTLPILPNPKGILRFSAWNVITVMRLHGLDVPRPSPDPSLFYLEAELLFLAFFVVRAEALGFSLAVAGG